MMVNQVFGGHLHVRIEGKELLCEHLHVQLEGKELLCEHLHSFLKKLVVIPVVNLNC